jgi:ADP-ribose pyrophosphatase YjhB (NUDIX family)
LALTDLPGETFQEAAIRETKEEAGIDVQLEGILQIQYTPRPSGGGRERIVFFATPVNPNQPPKSIPDYESQSNFHCASINNKKVQNGPLMKKFGS